MIDRLISFAEPDGEAYGAIALKGERLGGGYLRGPDTSLVIDDGALTRGEGSLRIEADGEDLLIGLAALLVVPDLATWLPYSAGFGR